MLHRLFFKIIITVLCLLSFCFNADVFANSKNDEMMKMYNNFGKISSSAPSSVGSNDKEDNQTPAKITTNSQSKDPYDDPFYLSKKNQEKRLEAEKQREAQQKSARNEEMKDLMLECILCGVPAIILAMYGYKKKYPLFNLLPKIAVMVLLIHYRNHTYFLKGTEFCELLTFIISLATVYEIGFKNVIALPFYLLALLFNPVESILPINSQDSHMLTYLVAALLFFLITIYLTKTTIAGTVGRFDLKNLSTALKKDNKSVIIESNNKFCPQCGNELIRNSNFCPNCGFEIQATSDTDDTFVDNTTASEDLIKLKAESDSKKQQTERKVYTDDDPTYAKILSDTGLLKPVGRRGRWDYFKVCVFWTLIARVISSGNSLISTIIYIYTDFVNTAKRLHDLNRPTKWAIFLSTIRFIIGLYFQFVVFAYEKSKDETIIFDKMPIMIGIVAVGLLPEIYFLFFKGTTGPNDYGPDPLQRKA